MIEPNSEVVPQWPNRVELRDALVRGDRALGRARPILSHLLSSRDHSFLSEAVVASVRGMLMNLASQILRIQADATGNKGQEAFAAEHGEGLAEAFYVTTPLVTHCHALAIEWQLARQLERQAGLDPVLSPFLQTCIGNENDQIASAAMAALAAQTRFAQSQRRMELPLGELPGELLHEALKAWREYGSAAQSDALDRAEARIRDEFDEAASRLSLFDRVAVTGTRDSKAALNIEQGGVALFLSALALRSGQPRDDVALSTNEHSMARLALGLRAAGLKATEVEAQMLRIHPDHNPPEGLDEIGTREAAQFLAGSDSGRGY